MSKVYTIIINRESPSLNEFIYSKNPFKHQRLKKDWYYLLRAGDGFLTTPKATGKRHLIIERHGKQEVDPDNIVGGAKLVITDNLRKWGLLIDDKEKYLKIEGTNKKLNPGEKPFTVIILEDING